MFVLHAKVKHDIRTYTTVKLLAIKLHTTGLYTVKPVYNGQLRATTKVTFVDRWPLFGASETTFANFTGRIKTGLCRQETTTRRCCYAHV